MDVAAANTDDAATQDDGSCQYGGCMDADDDNYLAKYTYDNGDCASGRRRAMQDVIVGCMASAAIAKNYDPAATQDGGCIFWISGCTDPNALNHRADADKDDGSCVVPVYGCTSETATNYDATATVDQGCLYAGCTWGGSQLGSCDQGCLGAAVNYDANAEVDDGSCVIQGCTNIKAGNYDGEATANDGSCIDIEGDTVL